MRQRRANAAVWAAGWVAALAAAPVHGATLHGEWTIEPTAGGWMRLSLRRPVIVNPVRTLEAAATEFRGLPTDLSSGSAAIEFSLPRDAGVFSFTGRLREGRGEGRFEFRESREFSAALRGLVPDWWDPEKLFEMAARHVRLASIQALRDSGATPLPAAGLLRLDPTRPGLALDLARARTLGVPPGYWRGLRETGYALFPDDAVRLHTHGIQPEFLRQMKTHGYDAMPVSDMIRLQTHGVTIQDMQNFEARGYRNLFTDEIVRLKTNGIPESK